MQEEHISKGSKTLGIILIILAFIGSFVVSAIAFGASYSAAWSGNYSGPSIIFTIFLLLLTAALAFVGANVYDGWEIFRKKENKISNYAITSFVLGIILMLWIVMLYTPFFIGVILLIPSAPLALIFGILGLNKIKKENQRGKGFAICGIMIGGFWILVPILTAISSILISIIA